MAAIHPGSSPTSTAPGCSHGVAVLKLPLWTRGRLAAPSRPILPTRVPGALDSNSYWGRRSTVTVQGYAKVEQASQWWKVDEIAWTDIRSPDQFEEVVSTGDKLLFVDFYATWCKGCQKSYPHLCGLAKDKDLLRHYKFVKVCVDEMKDLARTQSIKALPFGAVYKPGEGRLVGMDIPPSKVKHVKTNLQVIVMNPGKSYVCDPNGFVIPVAKSEEEKRVAEAEKKRKEAEQLGRQNGLLFNHLNSLSFSSVPQQAPPINNIVATHGMGSAKLESTQPVVQVSVTEDSLAAHAVGPQSLEKASFLSRAKSEYGYDGMIDRVYLQEVGCRMKPGEHYMDYTGAGVYCQSQVENVMQELRSHMLGNPHSMNPSSTISAIKVDEVRDLVLRYFHADPREYFVVFTRGATGSLKMVGEMFPWSGTSKFRYLRENHNSVLGIREYALRNGATFEAVEERVVEEWATQTNEAGLQEAEGDEVTYNLFAYPAEDNFAGVLYPLRWVDQVKQKSTEKNKWLVCLDAAAFVPTQPLDLREVPVDFLALSFYKMFGYPTGLGALIVKFEAAEILRKVFWGGGTVALATSGDDFHVLKCNPSDKLEDGTVAFLDIIALKHGFGMIDKVGGIHRIRAHVTCLTQYLYSELVKLKHSGGEPLVRIFGKHQLDEAHVHQGAIVNFELLKPDGTAYSYRTFELEAAEAGFHLRTGSECNPGACYRYLGLTDKEVEGLADIKEGCDDDVEFIRVQRPDGPKPVTTSDYVLTALNTSAVDLGHPAEVAMHWVEVPLGSTRVSLGYMSRFEDCYRLVEFIKDRYVDRP